MAIASNLARFALRADGVVLTKSGGGAPHVDMAELAHRCEQLGLATCLIAWDSSGTGSGDDGAALFNYPDLNAIVNFGNGDVPVAVRWHPYFLNPWVPREGMSRADYLTRKFGSVERYKDIAGRVGAAAAAEGLVYAVDKIARQPNTLDW